MCGPGLRNINDEECIPIIFNVTAEEYLMLLKKKKGGSWKELFLGVTSVL